MTKHQLQKFFVVAVTLCAGYFLHSAPAQAYTASPSSILTAAARGGDVSVQSFTIGGAAATNVQPVGFTLPAGAALASGDTDGDGTREIIAAFPRSNAIVVQVWTSSGSRTQQYNAFTTGVGAASLAAADTNGDGKDEIIISRSTGAPPVVRIFSATGTLQQAFSATSATYRGGVYVAGADVDNDGIAEVIVGSGRGAIPRVRIFSAQGTLIRSFVAYETIYRQGVVVGAGDVDGDGTMDIVTAPAGARTPDVRIFTTTGTLQRTIQAYASAYRGGVRLSVGDLTDDGASEIVTGTPAGNGAQVRVFAGGGSLRGSFFSENKTRRNGITILAYRKHVAQYPDYTVAFFGDQGLTAQSQALLQLIKDRGTDAVVHLGDYDYADNPSQWAVQFTGILGTTFPYLGVIGNHDVPAWAGYQSVLQSQYSRMRGVTCTGTLGEKAVCTFGGITVVFSGVGTSGSGHEAYLAQTVAAARGPWVICAWHKNQRLLQVGGKADEVGWEAYDTCGAQGAIVATAHEHSYSRTHALAKFSTQAISSTATTLHVGAGKSFAFVSGLGGYSVRNQDATLAANPWWASVYTSAQSAQAGALFCTFAQGGALRKASCTFRDIAGNTPDSFTLVSDRW